MTPRGYQPENAVDQLTEIEDHGRRVGGDPGALPLDVLTAAGHPRTNARSVINRMRESRLTTDGLQWIVERHEYGQWQELGFVLTRVGIWQICVDKGVVVGWDAEEAI